MPAALTGAHCAGLAGLLALAGGALAAAALPTRDATVLVSRQDRRDGGLKASGGSSEPSISASGRYVAFASSARNLSPDDRDRYRDVFVRDLARGITTLVSRASGRGGRAANGPSFTPRISADGRFVTFESPASNLSPADTDRRTHVYVRDLRRARTLLVSRADGHRGVVASAHATGASISGDGARVAFESPASNLTGADDDRAGNRYDVFVRYLRQGRTELVSRAGGRNGRAGSASAQARISTSGRFVAFDSGSGKLTPEGNRAVLEVYVRDLRRKRTELVSRATGRHGRPARITASQPVLSADGRFVAFESRDSRLGPGDGIRFDLFVRDRRRDTTRLVTPAASGTGGGQRPPECYSISGSGRFLAFERRVATRSGSKTAVFGRDLRGRHTTLISRASGSPGEPAAEDAGCPVLDRSGRYAAFTSLAPGLDPLDRDGAEDVFLRRWR